MNTHQNTQPTQAKKHLNTHCGWEYAQYKLDARELDIETKAVWPNLKPIPITRNSQLIVPGHTTSQCFTWSYRVKTKYLYSENELTKQIIYIHQSHTYTYIYVYTYIYMIYIYIYICVCIMNLIKMNMTCAKIRWLWLVTNKKNLANINQILQM